MSGRGIGARAVLDVLGPAVLVGVLGGALWAWWAEPARWRVVDGRIVMTEYASLDQFPVLLWFAAIGAVLSLLLALLAQLVRRGDWRFVAWLVVGSVVASLVAWRAGVWFGPADPRATAAGLAEGDTVPDRLGLGSVVPFLAWPIGACAGILLASVFDRAEVQERAIDDTTASVNEIRS